MSTDTNLAETSDGLAFEEFWSWVTTHPNCIVRAATSMVALFDWDDYHWHFGVEDPDTYVVQVIRGKRLVGEIILRPSEVGSVRYQPGEAQEHLFDLVDDEDRFICQFVLTHGLEENESSSPGRLTH